MFDGIDAGADGPFGSFGTMGVGGGFFAHAVGLVDEGVHFLLGELRGVDVVVEGHNAAGSADFDDVGTVLDVPADGGAHGIGTVTDGGTHDRTAERGHRLVARDVAGGDSVSERC